MGSIVTWRGGEVDPRTANELGGGKFAHRAGIWGEADRLMSCQALVGYSFSAKLASEYSSKPWMMREKLMVVACSCNWLWPLADGHLRVAVKGAVSKRY